MYVLRKIEARSPNCFRGKAKILSIMFVSVFLPSLSGMQMTSFLYRIILYLWPVWLYHFFPHYLINGTIFGKGYVEHKMCVLIRC
jgi:hypothetical protein